MPEAIQRCARMILAPAWQLAQLGSGSTAVELLEQIGCLE